MDENTISWLFTFAVPFAFFFSAFLIVVLSDPKANKKNRFNDEERAVIQHRDAVEKIFALRKHQGLGSPLCMRDELDETHYVTTNFKPEPESITRSLDLGEADLAATSNGNSNADELENQMDAIRQSIKASAEKLKN